MITVYNMSFKSFAHQRDTSFASVFRSTCFLVFGVGVNKVQVFGVIAVPVLARKQEDMGVRMCDFEIDAITI